MILGSLIAADADNSFNTVNEKVLLLVNNYIIPAIMTAAAVVFVILGIINGIRLAKATTEEEKTKAKKNLIGLAIGIIISVASIWLIPYLIDIAFGVFPNNPIQSPIG